MIIQMITALSYDEAKALDGNFEAFKGSMVRVLRTVEDLIIWKRFATSYEIFPSGSPCEVAQVNYNICLSLLQGREWGEKMYLQDGKSWREIDALKKEIASLKEQVLNLESENLTLKSEVSDLKNVINKRNRLIKSVRRTLKNS